MRCVKIIYSMVPGGSMRNVRLFESHAAANAWMNLHGYTVRAQQDGTIGTDADGQLVWVGDNGYSAPITVV